MQIVGRRCALLGKVALGNLEIDMADHTVKIQNFSYDPASLAIEAGDTVTWQNLDDMAHTATRTADPMFDTGLIRPGQQSDAATINWAPGTYDYACRPHPFMSGKLVVA